MTAYIGITAGADVLGKQLELLEHIAKTTLIPNLISTYEASKHLMCSALGSILRKPKEEMS